MLNLVPDVWVPLAAVLPAQVHDPQGLLVDLGGRLAGELGALQGLAAPQVVGGPAGVQFNRHSLIMFGVQGGCDSIDILGLAQFRAQNAN